MDRIELGTSGLQVSALCMGSDLLGSKHDRQTSFAVLDAFRAGGGSFLDTANLYAAWLPGCSGGESERVIGEWMATRGCRDEMVVGTKLGFDFASAVGGLSAAEIETQCNDSLKRLQTDRIDIYWSHRDDLDVPQAETMQAFDRLVQAGKVRAIGASNMRVWRIAQANEIARANGWTPYSAVQQRFTYLRPLPSADFGPQIVIGDELKSLVRETGLGLMAYSILITGFYDRPGAALPPQYVGPDSEQRLAVLDKVCGETGLARSQVVLAWVRQQQPAILPVIAGSRPEQIAQSIRALDLVLSAEQLDRLNRAGDPDDTGGWLTPS